MTRQQQVPISTIAPASASALQASTHGLAVVLLVVAAACIDSLPLATCSTEASSAVHVVSADGTQNAYTSNTMAAEATTTMRAIDTVDMKCVLNEAVPKPTATGREVLMKVHWSAVNRADTLQRKGTYPPPPGASPIIGLEASGVIESLGDACELGFAVGDRVMALLAGGGYAEAVAVDERLLIKVPDGMDLKTAGAIPETWLTAYQLLHFVGGVQAGDTVLIPAAGSGVGTAAIQLSVAAGATVVAVAGTDEKLATAKALGAAAGINYKEGAPIGDRVLEATDGKGVDLILDCVGASFWEEYAKAIKMEGRWVLYGLMGGPVVHGPILGAILRKRVRLEGTTLRTRSIEYKERLVRDMWAHAGPKFIDGSYKPVVATTFPLAEAQAAHEFVESNASHGKVMLQVVADE